MTKEVEGWEWVNNKRKTVMQKSHQVTFREWRTGLQKIEDPRKLHNPNTTDEQTKKWLNK
jgi:hypothetical protein